MVVVAFVKMRWSAGRDVVADNTWGGEGAVIGDSGGHTWHRSTAVLGRSTRWSFRVLFGHVWAAEDTVFKRQGNGNTKWARK